MTITIVQLPGAPILHCFLTGTITAGDIDAMIDTCTGLAAHLPGPVFRITETQDVATSFSDVVLILDTISRRERGPGPQFIDVLVGHGEMIELIADSVQQTQYGRQHIPLFADLDDALAYVRARINATHAA
ncbi:MAG: hypothetical protein K8S97_16990 [Anaerolineae bacterium]|nr:hypothetical protein [Anaerolineae bacterium]